MQHQQTEFDIRHYRYQGQLLSSEDLQQLRRSFSGRVPFYHYLFKSHLGADLNLNIVDVPCGHGNILFYLESKGYTNYQGYDIDNGRVETANRLGLKAAAADGLSVMKELSCVDVIFSLDFMEHLDRESAFGFAADCCTALKDDGVFIMRMPVTDSIRGAQDLYNDITHKWSANSQVIKAVLLQHGFRTVEIIDERPVPYKFVNVIRRLIFNCLSFLVNLGFLALGFHKIRVWSTSCFFICRK